MRRFFPILLVCILLLGTSALAAENLLVNGGFEEGTDGQPTGWTADMWLYDVGVSFLELHEGGSDGGWCVMIENVSRNDARYIQEVAVQPNTLYRFSAWVKAVGCDPAYAGAGISVMDTYVPFPQEYDTNGEWVYQEVWLRTAADQHKLDVGVRLGGYSADNTGIAYFDDVFFGAEEDIPAGVEIISLSDYAMDQTTASTNPENNIDIWMPLALFAVLILVLWMLRAYRMPMPYVAICLLLIAATLLRLYLMATQPGYKTDMDCFFSWSATMVNVGPNAFYETVSFCDYPPGYMYLLWATGWIMELFEVHHLSAAGRIIVKLMPMLADLAAIALLWKLARKALGEMPALLLAALYAFSPAILIDGAVWGQVDAVLALGLLATVALVMKRNWMAALPVFMVTVLMKPQALMAGPIGLIALVMDILPWKEGGKKVAQRAAIGLGIAVAAAAALLLPFLWGKEEPVSWILGHYGSTLGSYAHATLNTANLFYLMGANWVPLDTALIGSITYGHIGTVLMVVVVLGTMALYVWRKDRALLPFFGAMIFIGLYLLGIRMHERYLFPAFALLLLAYVYKRDWRLLVMFIGFSVTFLINCAIVLNELHLPLGYGVVGCILAVINLGLYGIGLWMAFDRRERILPDAPLPELPPEVEEEDPQKSLKKPTASDEAKLQSLAGRTPPMARMRAKDWVSVVGITLVYAAIAYIGLGSTVAPQTVWTSSGAAEQVVFDLGESKEFEILYYCGVNSRDHTFSLEFSEDGEYWMDATVERANMGDCFRWQYAVTAFYDEGGNVIGWGDDPIMPIICGGRYVRMTTNMPGVTMMEMVFRTLDGEPIQVASVESIGARAESASDPWALVDEPQTVPENPSYYNGTYFDEIYHARTGYEHANGLKTYETTHPPLGKVFIMIGIKLFGMTPFGWRFMGALAGVLMVPAMYMLGKVLFKKTRYAFLAAFLMAFDMMHLTQTRIATIDSYAVLFIILMYTCMFRYLQMSFFRDGWRTLIPLGLSGLFMGLGCASKWICIYAGAGLAVLFAWSMVRHYLQWRAAVRAGEGYERHVEAYPKYLIGTLGACLVFFIAIPAAIYYFSYIPYFAWEGGLTWKRFWDAQVNMFSYHANLVDDHGFQSPWYEWPLMLKPMYYYTGTKYLPEGMGATIMAMGNPAVWWVGLGTFLYMGWQWLRPRLRYERTEDHRPAMLLLAFAAQFLPWVLVPRSTFIYHYFGSLPFVMLSIVYAFERLHARWPKGARITQGVYMGVILVLFAAFYPAATGIPVSEGWLNAINWLGFLRLPGWKYKGWIYH